MSDRRWTHRVFARVAMAMLVVAAGCDVEETPPTIVGTLQRDSLELVAEARERIVEVLVSEGDRVESGQLLMRLDASTVRDRTTVTRLLDGMVDKGLVRRETDPDDRRGVCTWLTPEGTAPKNQLIPAPRGCSPAPRGESPRKNSKTVAGRSASSRRTCSRSR